MKQGAVWVDEKLEDARLIARLERKYGEPEWKPFTQADLEQVQREQFQQEHNAHDGIGSVPTIDRTNSGCILNALCLPVFLFIWLMGLVQQVGG